MECGDAGPAGAKAQRHHTALELWEMVLNWLAAEQESGGDTLKVK